MVTNSLSSRQVCLAAFYFCGTNYFITRQRHYCQFLMYSFAMLPVQMYSVKTSLLAAIRSRLRVTRKCQSVLPALSGHSCDVGWTF